MNETKVSSEGGGYHIKAFIWVVSQRSGYYSITNCMCAVEVSIDTNILAL